MGRADAHLILFGGDVQRRVAVLGGGVRGGAFIQQQQGHVLVVVVAGHVQRCDAVLPTDEFVVWIFHKTKKDQMKISFKRNRGFGR